MKYISKATSPFFAFNIWDVNSARAVIDAANALHRDVILQTSARVFATIDKAEFLAYLRAYSVRQNVHAYIHLDHCADMRLITQAIDAGWDSVMVDMSRQSIMDNARMTAEVCRLAHAHGILVEAEVGPIVSANEADIGVASIEEIDFFLQHTDIDLLAAAIGTAHGMYHGTPAIHYDLIHQIGELTQLPFVIHGGSGLGDCAFRQLLACPNVKKINISTELKLAYRQAIVQSWGTQLFAKEGFEATKIEKVIYDSIQQVAQDKMQLLLS